jgi:hypothetical protein
METDRSEIDTLLQDCLDEMSGGSASIASVLSKHPEIQAQLQPDLEAAVWFQAHRERLIARPGFIRRSRRHLYSQIRKDNPARQFFKRKVELRRWESSPAVQLILALLLVMALLANTNSLMAAAGAAVPGDQFYGVKLACESVQMGLASSPTRQAVLHAAFAHERMGEMIALVLEGRTQALPELVRDYEAHSEEAVLALRTLARQDPDRTRALAAQLENEVFKQAEVLALVKHTLPDEHLPSIEQASRVSEMGVTAVQALLREQASLP